MNAVKIKCMCFGILILTPDLILILNYRLSPCVIRLILSLYFNAKYHWQKGLRSMDCQRIIMNFTVAPSADDLEALATSIMETMPEELLRECNELVLAIEDIADETILSDLDLEDSFDLLALYKSAKEISPGIERKVANEDDVLVLYRRTILDMWCETGEDLQALIRQVMIEELGRFFEFSDDDIEEMTERHYQGLL